METDQKILNFRPENPQIQNYEWTTIVAFQKKPAVVYWMRQSVYSFLKSGNGVATISQLNQIQARLIVNGEIGDPLVVRELTARFAIHDPSNAQALLRVHPSGRSVSGWNTVIKVLSENHQPENVFILAKKMVRSNLLPDNYTLSFILRAGAEISDVTLVSMYHSLVIRVGFEQHDYVQNGLMHCYANCEYMDSARKIFDASCNRDIISWTTVINGYLKIGEACFAQKLFDKMPEKNSISCSAMINGYAQMGMFREAVTIFNDMLIAGIKPTHSAMVGALSACSHLGDLFMGNWIHSYIHRLNLKLNLVLGTALIDMYAKCGCIDKAHEIFDEMPHHDVYAYTSLILGLADHGKSTMALELFRRMQRENVRPNKVTFLVVITACSRMGYVQEGLEIFRSMKEDYGILPEPQHYGCLVDLLARAGLLEQADMVVNTMSTDPDPYALGSLLNACRVYDNFDLEKVKTYESNENRSGVQVLVSNIYASGNNWNDVQRVRKWMQERRVIKITGSSSLLQL